MLLPLLLKTWRDRWRGLVAWTTGLVLITAVELYVYPSIRDSGEGMEALIEGFPDAMQEIFRMSDYTSGAGFLNVEMFSIIVPLVFIAVGATWGAGGTADEEEKGTADLLLTLPVSRAAIVVTKMRGDGRGAGGADGRPRRDPHRRFRHGRPRSRLLAPGRGLPDVRTARHPVRRSRIPRRRGHRASGHRHGRGVHPRHRRIPPVLALTDGGRLREHQPGQSVPVGGGRRPAQQWHRRRLRPPLGCCSPQCCSPGSLVAFRRRDIRAE